MKADYRIAVKDKCRKQTLIVPLYQALRFAMPPPHRQV